jgi:hypothetical protein
MIQRIAILATILTLASGGAIAQDNPPQPKGKLSGYMFGDYFYNIGNHDRSMKDLNGFQFRRIYLTYDHAISPEFDSRFRLEADQSANTSDGKIGVFVKDAYLRWKNLFEGSDLFFGISPTPAFEISEDHWGYRSLEKTIMDLRGIVSSRDFGADLRGRITGDGTVNYWVKLGNNSGNRPLSNKYHRYYGQLHFKPDKNWQATVYADLASAPSLAGDLSNNRIVLSAFAGYRNETFAAGIEGFYRTVQNGLIVGTTRENLKTLGVSAFAWGKVADQVRLIGRVDFYDPNTSVDKDGNYLFIGALDYMPVKDVHVMPNLLVQSYQATGADSDVTGRMTFYYVFR